MGSFQMCSANAPYAVVMAGPSTDFQDKLFVTFEDPMGDPTATVVSLRLELYMVRCATQSQLFLNGQTSPIATFTAEQNNCDCDVCPTDPTIVVINNPPGYDVGDWNTFRFEATTNGSNSDARDRYNRMVLEVEYG